VTESALTLRFDVVDVFADRPFTGNPLAVVHGADGLDTEQLQAIAREFNLSETVFPLPARVDGASYRARIFTPVEELPFAGHPSVGVAWVLARDGVIGAGDAVQECGAGLLPVSVDSRGARISGGPPRVGPTLDAEPLALAAGLVAADVDPVSAPGVAGAGLDHVFLPVRPDAVARAVIPELGALRAAAGGRGMLNVISLDLAAGRVHSRMFGPGSGVPEDPATGSAAVALGVYLVDRGLLPSDGEAAFTIYQGAEMHRPSRLEVEVRARSGAAVTTSVGGRVVPVSSGHIALPTREP
jgi:trans-2,3-dihydro-3-hydroxyanthranilate isomerase